MGSDPAIRKGRAVLLLLAPCLSPPWASINAGVSLFWRLCRQGAIQRPVDYLRNRNLRGCSVHPFPLAIQILAQQIDRLELPPTFHPNRAPLLSSACRFCQRVKVGTVPV